VLAAAATTTGIATSSAAASSLSLVAYSTPQEAYNALIPAFNKTAAGKGVSISKSFGGSGDQSRAVAAGLPADVVAFSLAPDIDRLVKAGLVGSDWNKDRFNGFVTRSVVTLTVRKGNPKKIKTWNDLIKPGVDVLVPNFKTSGGAKWDVAAIYYSQLRAGKTPQQSFDFLKAFYQHVSVQDTSAREALQTFQSGKGDVLVGYENEAIGAKKKGVKLDFVTPARTLLIENPIAVVKTSSNLGKAKAFVSFVRSAPGQTIFAKKGYRPVLGSVAKAFAASYPRPAKLFQISQIGGWDFVNKELFDNNNGLAVKAQQ
jgi:sulfate transport system substrate-binding protein